MSDRHDELLAFVAKWRGEGDDTRVLVVDLIAMGTILAFEWARTTEEVHSLDAVAAVISAMGTTIEQFPHDREEPKPRLHLVKDDGG